MSCIYKYRIGSNLLFHFFSLSTKRICILWQADKTQLGSHLQQVLFRHVFA